MYTFTCILYSYNVSHCRPIPAMSKQITVCRYINTVRGHGTYARVDLTPGTKVWVESSDMHRNIYTFQPEELQQMTQEMKQRVFCYGTVIDDGKVEVSPYLTAWVRGEIDEIKHEECPSNINFINHSCEPNLVWQDNHTLIAWRHIRAGEELTYDYRTEDFEVAPFQCECGTKTCCSTVGGQEWRKKELQDKYGRYFQECILNAMLQGHM